LFTSPFFRRLFLPYLLLICAAMSILGFVEARRLRESYLERTQQSLRNNVRLMAEIITPLLKMDRNADLNRQIKRLGASLGYRVTILKSDGVVIADNEADSATMENHGSRPEIIQAVSNGEGISVRESATVHAAMLYFASRIDGGDAGPHYLRLSVHLRQLDDELKVLYGRLASATLITMLAAAAICYYFARKHAAPLVELTAFADVLAKGELSRRLSPPGGGEVAKLAGALNSMAQALSRLIDQSAKDKAELLAMLASMSEGVIATDTSQRIRLSNAAALRLLDLGEGAIEGKLLWEVTWQEAILRATGQVLETREARTIRVGPIAGRHLDVAICPFPLNATPAGLVIVSHDVTEAVRYQDLRKEFVANVSHELRTPLSVIKGFAETLADGALNDPVKGPHYLGLIEKHTGQLANLVNDLLDLARLEGHPMLPSCSPVDLGAIARQAVEGLRSPAEKKEQAVSIKVQYALPQVAGNADYLERAIANLVDNAIKYTPAKGKIAIAVNAEDSAVVVRVTDSGIGIPEEDLPRIFERFYRVDRSRSRDMGGTGLGLSIVKHVMQSHGGSIGVTSSVGGGSTFTLTFPLRETPAA
jgi:two-component system phosphate regulon sensor histidine kinase PhoR